MSKEKIFIKFIRAKAKTQYHKAKQDECWICGSTKDLELHHNKPLSSIVKEYLAQHKIVEPTNDKELREKILNSCSREIYGRENLVTLCRQHHKALHDIFGKSYNIKVSDKVKNYLQRQKERLQHG